MTDSDLTALDRERFLQLATAILPGPRTMSAADVIGMSGALLDEAVAALPPVATILGEILRRPIGDVGQFLEELRAQHPSQFATLVLVTAATYYLSPAVRAQIGYRGQEALGIDVFDLPNYLEDGTLDRVTARGAFYRDVDPEEVGRDNG